MSTPEKYITVKQLAEHLAISPKTVMNKTQLGQIPCHRLPGSSRPRYRLSEVERVMVSGYRRRGRRVARNEK